MRAGILKNVWILEDRFVPEIRGYENI